MQIQDLSIGDTATITGYATGDKNYRRKLLTLGLTPGTELKLVGIAPLGDPVKILVRGLALCLRKAEAHILKLEKFFK